MSIRATYNSHIQDWRTPRCGSEVINIVCTSGNRLVIFSTTFKTDCLSRFTHKLCTSSSRKLSYVNIQPGVRSRSSSSKQLKANQYRDRQFFSTHLAHSTHFTCTTVADQ